MNAASLVQDILDPIMESRDAVPQSSAGLSLQSFILPITPLKGHYLNQKREEQIELSFFRNLLPQVPNEVE